MNMTQTINRTWTKFAQWREIARQRRALDQLGDQMLKDIGLSRVDAEREARRHFWDAAANGDRTLRRRGDTGHGTATDKTGMTCCTR